MKIVVILLLCLCHLSLKAHDLSHGAEKPHHAGYVQLRTEKENSQVGCQSKLSAQNEYLIVLEDEDGDWMSARKYTLLAKSPLTHFFSLILPDSYLGINSRLLYYSQLANSPNYKYITQRVLRI